MSTLKVYVTTSYTPPHDITAFIAGTTKFRVYATAPSKARAALMIAGAFMRTVPPIEIALASGNDVQMLQAVGALTVEGHVVVTDFDAKSGVVLVTPEDGPAWFGRWGTEQVDGVPVKVIESVNGTHIETPDPAFAQAIHEQRGDEERARKAMLAPMAMSLLLESVNQGAEGERLLGAYTQAAEMLAGHTSDELRALRDAATRFAVAIAQTLNDKGEPLEPYTDDVLQASQRVRAFLDEWSVQEAQRDQEIIYGLNGGDAAGGVTLRVSHLRTLVDEVDPQDDEDEEV